MSSPTALTPPALVLTISPWDEPKRLRKQIAEVLSQDGEVIYVTLPHGFRKPSRSRDYRDGAVRVVALSGPPLPLRVLRWLPPVRELYERLLAWRLRRTLRDVPRIGAVFCFTPEHPRVVGSFPGVPVIYVANDDHASMAGSDADSSAIRRSEARAIALSDRVVSVSEVIARKLAVHGKPVQVMYPGHDCGALPLCRFEEDERVPGSVCFFGYIDWRVDFELLAFLMDNGRRVVLIGPVVGTAEQLARLQVRFPDRFEVLPSLATHEAPAVLTRYEVLAIPYRYRSAEQAEVMELPNKTFIYFCALRPIVTTDMPNLKLVQPGLIYRSRSQEEFLANCSRAVREDSLEHAADRQRIAEQNTWEARRATLRSLTSNDIPAASLSAS